MRIVVLANVLILGALVAQPAVGQTPLGTGFTYQGKLDDDGMPADGLHDMQFQLFTLASGGTPVGSTVCVDGVDVVDGLFTVSLDFGSAYDGNQRFLEVSVRADGTPANCGGGTYTMLSPRQPLTAMPYALYALTGPGSGGPWATSGNNVFNTNTGNVGIGTATPGGKLDIQASDNSNVLFGRRTGGGLTHNFFVDGAGNGSMQLRDSAGTTRVSLVSGDFSYFTYGNVGIGTTTPKTTLHVNGQSLWLTGGSGAGLGTSAGEGLRLYYDQNTDLGQVFVYDYATNTPKNLILQDLPNAKVGVGTSNPNGGLHVKREPVTNGGTLTLEGTTHTYISFFPDGAGAGRKGFLGFPGAAINDIQVTNEIPGGHIVLSPGSGGGVWVPVLNITGADLAEKFPTSEANIEPGMVVAIDPQNPGKLCLARGAYNRCVAGVVSGANDFAAGAILGNQPGCEDAPPIALSGRVYVHCDASSAPIQPGDLLTTSDRPGHAMKASDRERAHGAVIGKAMTSLDTGRGLVLVLVQPQ